MKLIAKTIPECTNHNFPCALTLLCSYALVFLSSYTLVRAALPETARLVPPETVLLVDIDDLKTVQTQLEKTSFYKLYKDPAMVPFIEDAKEKIGDKVKQAKSELIRTMFDADTLPQGRTAFVLVLNKQAIDANGPTALFITQWGENFGKIKETVNKMVEQSIEAGSKEKTENYRGIDIKTILSGDSSRLGYGFSSKLSYCFLDDCLFGSEDIDLLKFVIAQIRGADSPTLADDADYTATMRTVGPDRHIGLFVNIKQIIKTVIAEDAAGKTKTVITNLGFDNVRSIGGSVALAPKTGLSVSGKAFVKIDGEKRGICEMLEFETVPLRAPKFLPDTVYSLAFINFNFKRCHDILSGILRSFSPAAAAILYMPIVPPTPDGQPGLQLKTDIIDHLGSQIIVAQSASTPRTAGDAPAPESLLALAISNRSALESSLSRIHGMFSQNNPDARRQLLGYTMYLVDLSALLPAFTPGTKKPMQAISGPTPSVLASVPKAAFTITDTHLILGLESAVERAIRTLSEGGTASTDFARWFNRAKSTIPDVVGLAGLENDAILAEILWKAMKKNAESKSDKPVTDDAGSRSSIGLSLSSGSGLMFSQQGLDLFDFSLLPEYDLVRKYFGLSVSYVVTRPDGFFQEFRYIDSD